MLGALLLATILAPEMRANAASTNLPPVISGFAPSSAYPGTLILINGSNLVQVSSIWFGDVSAPVYGGVDDGTIVQTQVPSGASTGPVTVVTASGSGTSSQDFEVLGIPSPAITQFTPTSGAAGALVQFEGTGLINVTNVSFNGVDAFFITMTGLAAYVPTNATTGPITVRTKQGAFTTTQDFLITSASPPTISSFSPKSGYSGTSVTITGENLTRVRSVRFGGVPSDLVSTMLETMIWARVPANAESGQITVVTEAGEATSPDPFTVISIPPPMIDTMIPTRARPGELVSITGHDLFPSPIVTLNGVRAELLGLGGENITFFVPYALSGPVSVTTAGGTATAAQILTVIDGPPEPELVGFSPTNGLVGTSISIRAHNLGEVRQVTFNGAPASFQQYGHEQIVALVPPSATPGPIQVESVERTLTTAAPFYVFNSGHLAVATSATLSITSAVAQVTFSTTITNLSENAIQRVNVTNWLGAWPGPSAEPLEWRDGRPVLTMGLLDDVSISDVTVTQGAITRSTNAVVVAIESLGPGQSCSVLVQLQTEGHHFFFALPAVTALDLSGNPVYGAALVSINNGIHLSVEALNDNAILIRWPFTDPPMALETTESLDTAPAWKPSPAEVLMMDGQNAVRIEHGSAQQLYRLVEKR